MESAFTKVVMVVGLLGALALSAANPTLARTNQTAASTAKVTYYTCDAYWLARGYYAHYYGSAACYACRGSY
jgi:hypothetical protein